jgi:hypothetical protein
MKAFKCRPEMQGGVGCARVGFDLIYSLTGESSPPHTRKGRLMQAKVGKYVTLLIYGLSRGNDLRRNLIADEEMRIKYPSSDHGARRAGNFSSSYCRRF